MKKVLPWVKSNLVIVICTVIALVAFPTLFVFSSGWNKRLNETVAQEVSGGMRELNAISVTYEAPGLDPAQPPVSISRVPNEATTVAIKSWFEALQAEAERLSQLVLQENDPVRSPLVRGLFPEPAPAESTSKRQEMARVWPNANRRLLREAEAGEPPSEEVVYDRLLSRFEAERQRLLGVGAGEEAALPAEDAIRIYEQLGQDRLAIYEDRADSIRFYASPNVFANVTTWDETRGAPSIEQCWEWQFRYWAHQDILKALVMANTDIAGQQSSAIYGAIKRVESIAVAPWDLEGVVRSSDGRAPATANLTGEIRRDYNVSPSGRTAWSSTEQNPIYDIRYVDLSLIVDSARVAQVIEAFPRAGLMSVVDMPLVEDYDPAPDLAQGYFYGPDPVVRVRLRVETLWLRQWMAPMMPPSVRAVLKVPDDWANPTDEASEENEEALPAVG